MKNILLFIETIVRKITRKIQKLQKYIYINIINNTSLIDKLVVVYLYLVCFFNCFYGKFCSHCFYLPNILLCSGFYSDPLVFL